MKISKRRNKIASEKAKKRKFLDLIKLEPMSAALGSVGFYEAAQRNFLRLEIIKLSLNSTK